MSWLRKVLGGARRDEETMAEALAAWNGGHPGVALDLWAPLAHRGHARAQSNMGAALLEGRGVERDPVKAVAWLRRAAEQGDADAQDMLSWIRRAGGNPAGAVRRSAT